MMPVAWPRLRIASIVLAVLLASPALADVLDCSNLNVEGQSFDLTGLAGLRESTTERSTPPTTVRTTYSISLCAALPRKDGVAAADQCPEGTRICVTTYNVKSGESDRITSVVPITGTADYDAKYSAKLISDGDRKGLLLTMGGMNWDARDQEARLSLICDTTAPSPAPFTVTSWEKDVLTVEWRSASACVKGTVDVPPPSAPGSDQPKKSRGLLGTFFMLLFIGFLAYIVVGIWVQRNQYGASGWDMIPNRDMWRDLPYVIRDALTPSRSARAGYSSLG